MVCYTFFFPFFSIALCHNVSSHQRSIDSLWSVISPRLIDHLSDTLQSVIATITTDRQTHVPMLWVASSEMLLVTETKWTETSGNAVAEEITTSR